MRLASRGVHVACKRQVSRGAAGETAPQETGATTWSGAANGRPLLGARFEEAGAMP